MKIFTFYFLVALFHSNIDCSLTKKQCNVQYNLHNTFFFKILIKQKQYLISVRYFAAPFLFLVCPFHNYIIIFPGSPAPFFSKDFMSQMQISLQMMLQKDIIALIVRRKKTWKIYKKLFHFAEFRKELYIFTRL